MPMPTPSKDEKQSAFVSRCMSFLDDEGSKLSHEQRLAACYSAYRRAKGIKSSEGDMPESKLVLFSGNKEFSKVDVKLSSIRLWRKQVLKLGIWRHPEDKNVKFEITPKVVEQIVANFNAGVPTNAPVTATHSDDPRAKLGEVKSFVATPDGLDAVFSVDDEKLNENIASSEKAPGVSCWLNLNYQHKESGDKIGAVVKHVALVNHPYIEGMAEFKAVLSEAEEDEKNSLPLVFMSEKKTDVSRESNMDKDELIKKLKEEHKIDVSALLSDSEGLKAIQKKIEDGKLVEKIALSDELQKKIREEFELSEDEEINVSDILIKLLSKSTDKKDATATKLSEMEKKNEDLQKRLDGKDADEQVGILLSGGFITPGEKDSMKKLYLSDSELFKEMAESKKKAGPVVKLGEDGTTGEQDASKEKELDEELKRQTEAAKEEGLI